MISVVHVITQLELGGAQENTLYTCQQLSRARFKVALIHGPGGLLDLDARALADTELIVLPELIREPSPVRDAACVRALKHHFERLRAEHVAAGHDRDAFIVHTHSSKAGVLGRLAARAAHVRHVVHTIHGFGFHEGQPKAVFAAYVAAERAAARLTEAFISVSRANVAEAIARGIVSPRHQVEVIRSGMPLEELFLARDNKAPARVELGLPADAEVLLSIGNFKPQKDPLTLLRAFTLLAARRPKAVLLLAGDGELRAEVEAEIERAGLGDRARLLGWRRDVATLLAAADVVTLASIFEGLPKSAVQAVAAGRPFVGTRVDGTGEIIHEGKNGYLVEPRSPAALATALDRALELRPVDPADRARLSAWDGEVMVRAQESLYERLVAQATDGAQGGGA